MRGFRSTKAKHLQPRLTLDQLRRKDAELAELVRMKPAMIVCLAECLAVFKERKWHWELAASQFGDFSVQYCGQSKSWADQHARLGLRLRELPALRAAILRGEVPISQAMKLASVVESEDEKEWLHELRGKSATSVAALLRAEPEPGEKDDEGDDEEDDYVVWSSRTNPLQLAWLRASLMLLEAVAGSRLTRDDLVEAFIAEILTTLLARTPESGGFDTKRQAAITEARRLNRITRYDAERRAEPSLPRPQPITPIDIPIPTDLRGAFRLLRMTCKRLDGLDLSIGRRANEIWASDGWRRLGYASEQQYCEERIGMSLRSVRSKRALARQCQKLPALGKALASGKISSVQATLIAKVATPKTAPAWVRRAEQRTAKHLREEIDAAEACGTRRPTTKGQLKKVVGLEQAVNGLADPGARPPRQLSASLYRQNGVFEWRMRRSQRDRIYALVQMYEKWGSPYGAFLDFAPIAIFSSQVLDPERIKSEFYDVAQRDLGCTNPLCTNRDCSAHHILFRSRGGTDDRWNLTANDTICHLTLIHLLRSLRVSGRAPDELTWELGPPDIGFEVVGRKLIRPKRHLSAAA